MAGILGHQNDALAYLVVAVGDQENHRDLRDVPRGGLLSVDWGVQHAAIPALIVFAVLGHHRGKKTVDNRGSTGRHSMVTGGKDHWSILRLGMRLGLVCHVTYAHRESVERMWIFRSLCGNSTYAQSAPCVPSTQKGEVEDPMAVLQAIPP